MRERDLASETAKPAKARRTRSAASNGPASPVGSGLLALTPDNLLALQRLTGNQTVVHIQRKHVDGEVAPEALCTGYVKLAQQSANPYGFHLLNLVGVSTEVLQAHNWGEACRKWLDEFDHSDFDQQRIAAADVGYRRVRWYGPQTGETWERLRTKAEGWRAQAEKDYEQYSEMSEKNRPSPEELEEMNKAAISGIGGGIAEGMFG